MRSRRIGSAVVLAGLLLGATACSGDDEPEEPAAEETTEAVDPGRVSPPDLPEVPEVANEVGAVTDLELGECATGPGEVEVAGEVTNSADIRRDVVVVVSWTNDTSDVLGRGVAVVQDLPAGETRDVTVTAQVADGATQCVPNVRRGVVRGG